MSLTPLPDTLQYLIVDFKWGSEYRAVYWDLFIDMLNTKHPSGLKSLEFSQIDQMTTTEPEFLELED